MGLVREDVEARAQPPGRKLGDEGVLVDDRSARGVDQAGAVPEQPESPSVEQPVRLVGEGDVDRDDVGLAEQIVELAVTRGSRRPRGACGARSSRTPGRGSRRRSRSGRGRRSRASRRRSRRRGDHRRPSPTPTSRLGRTCLPRRGGGGSPARAPSSGPRSRSRGPRACSSRQRRGERRPRRRSRRSRPRSWRRAEGRAGARAARRRPSPRRPPVPRPRGAGRRPATPRRRPRGRPTPAPGTVETPGRARGEAILSSARWR